MLYITYLIKINSKKIQKPLKRVDEEELDLDFNKYQQQWQNKYINIWKEKSAAEKKN